MKKLLLLLACVLGTHIVAMQQGLPEYARRGIKYAQLAAFIGLYQESFTPPYRQVYADLKAHCLNGKKIMDSASEDGLKARGLMDAAGNVEPVICRNFNFLENYAGHNYR